MDTRTKIAPRLLALAITIGALTLSGPQDLSAQWSLEGRAGVAIPLGDLTDDPGLNQTSGLGFAGAVYYTLRTNLSFYGEAGWYSFNCDECEPDVETWGFDAGLKYVLWESGAAFPWVRAGATLQQVSAGDADGQWGFGFDSGFGIDWMVHESLALVPAVFFDWYEADELTVSYASIGLGAHWHP